MHPATLNSWAHGYKRTFPDRRDVEMGPVISSISAGPRGETIPFVGLIEATVVQAFRSTGLPLQRVRKAVEVLRDAGELRHAIASQQLYTDGANVLYGYAQATSDHQMRLLTIVGSGQTAFHEVIDRYLTRIQFDDDEWATELIVPSTPNEILRIRPNITNGDPIFMRGGAPLYAVASRWRAGEKANSIADDYGVPRADIEEAIRGVYPTAA